MMLCDELKAIESATAVFENVHLVYQKSEVDAAIDELKREHHKERHEYIDMVAQLKAKLVEQESENRKLKRALWLARAERAKNMQTNRVFLKGYLRNHKNSWLAKDKELAGDLFKEAFEIVESKCRAKAEEYK